MNDAVPPAVWRRRSLLGAVVATPMVAGGVLAGTAASAAAASESPARDRIPPDTLPGGAYDRYVAQLAAEGKFSGVVLLSHRGRTVLSRSYGMADREKGIRNHERTAFNLSSAGKPFRAVAILQLAQQGKLRLSDTVGTHLTGFAEDVAERVTIHHVLTGTSGLNTPDLDVQRIFRSRKEVREYYGQWARRTELLGIPGTPNTWHAGAETAIPALIVEAVSGMTYWDYVQKNIFRRCGMTGSAFYTRPQWLTDKHIAHPYMRLADGSEVDAVRNLDKGSARPEVVDQNPGRAYIDAPGDAGFATAPDLARFGHALGDGTVLDRPWADVLTAPMTPLGPASFGTYGPSASIVGRQWMFQRAGSNPGVGANWDIYPENGWVGVILSNRDDVPLVEMIGQEMQAVTGVAPEEGGGG